MRDATVVVGAFGLWILILAVPIFFASISSAKKASKTGPNVISVSGELGLAYSDFVVVFLLSWIGSSILGIIGGFGAHMAGLENPFKWMLIVAGLVCFFLGRKLLTRKASRKLTENKAMESDA